MSLFANSLTPMLLLGSTPAPAVTAPTSTGQWVSDILSGLAIAATIVLYIVSRVERGNQRAKLAEQAVTSAAAVTAEATRREEEIQKLRDEAVRRDKELSLLQDEAENRRTEIELLTRQVDAAQEQMRRATKAQANRVQVKKVMPCGVV